MGKLLPPQIEATLPAFAGTKLIVPVKMNNAVSPNEIIGFKCRIKTAIDNEQKDIIDSTTYEINQDIVQVEFDTSSLQLIAGQFYKIQLAYYDNEEIGFFSTVGIIKYCSPIDLFVFGLGKLNDVNVNQENGFYIGKYISKDDPGEKVFEYRFDLLDENKKIIETTNWQLHNTMQDNSNYESEDKFIPKTNFIKNKLYYLQYSVKTVNNLNISTEYYKIISYTQISSDLQCSLELVGNNENGSIDIYLKPVANNSIEIITGSFVLSKLNTVDNIWEDIYFFNFLYENPFKKIFTDYIIEQNKEYIYSIRQYNKNNIYSERIISQPIKVDFEDMFLFDGEKQLRIKFNPKVSSFKNVVFEQKINTIGSKYPYIVKNGFVNYKEFPISGLLSYKEDDRREFIKYPEMPVNYNNNLYSQNGINLNDTNLTDVNIYLEREFKLSVLDWLTNGKTKLFKSPIEGNYLVRLLNVNLTPNDTLGRMLHTFSCNALEVADCSYSELINNNIIPKDYLNKSNKKTTYWKTIPLMEINEKNLAKYRTEDIIINPPSLSVTFDDVEPGSKFIINNALEIVIGTTGSYCLNNVPVKSISFPKGDNIKYTGSITYTGTSTQTEDNFSLITQTALYHVPVKQFLGFKLIDPNILANINNIKDELSQLNQLVFFKIDNNNFDIYKSNNLDDKKNYKLNIDDNSYKIQFVYDKNNKQEIDLKDSADIKSYSYTNMKAPQEIRIGNAIGCNISYSFIRKHFSLETKSEQQYDDIKQPEERLQYLKTLEEALNAYRKEHGFNYEKGV